MKTLTRMEMLQELIADRAFARKVDLASDFIAPGYEPLTQVSERVGVRAMRTRLCTGDVLAFLWFRDGEIKECGSRFWLSDEAEAAIANGYFKTARLLVRQDAADLLNDANNPGDEGVYLSPFMRLMVEASKHFSLGAEAGKRVKKEVLVEWFVKRTLSDGTKISNNIADSMATLCRQPGAMRGGNKR